MEYSEFLKGPDHLKEKVAVHCTCCVCGKQESIKTKDHRLAQFFAQELRKGRGWHYAFQKWYCQNDWIKNVQPIGIPGMTLPRPVSKLRVTLTFTDGTMVGSGDVDFSYLMALGESEGPGAVAYTASLIWLNWLKENKHD